MTRACRFKLDPLALVTQTLAACLLSFALGGVPAGAQPPGAGSVGPPRPPANREIPTPDQLEPAVTTTPPITPAATPEPAAATSDASQVSAPAPATSATGAGSAAAKGSGAAQGTAAATGTSTSKGTTAPKAKGGKGPSRLELDATEITGNRELPKVLYIVPWKRSDLGEIVGRPVNSLLDEVLQPLDRDVFQRQNRYYDGLKGAAGAPKPGPQPDAATPP